MVGLARCLGGGRYVGVSEIVWFNETTSTNDDAKAFAATQEVATERWMGAGSQTAGRGRQGRGWESPKGNLYASWVGAVECSLAQAAQLSFVAALAVSQAITHYQASADLRFKWPNDILLGGKKCCGILLEALQKQHLWIIVGIGVNLQHAPTKALYPATALGLNTSPQDFLAQLAKDFAHLKGLWQKEGFSKIQSLWLDRAHKIGDEILVRLPDQEIAGTFAGLNASGALSLATPQGTKIIEAGDVFFSTGANQ